MMFWPECYPEYAACSGTEDLSAHFGLGNRMCVPCNFNPVPAFREVILSETETHVTKIDALGVTCTVEKGTSAMPHYIDFPIKDRKSFEAYRLRLDPDSPERLGDLEAFAGAASETGALTELISRGLFAFLRDFMPFETLMITFCDDPELIAEMTCFHADFLIRLWGRVFDREVEKAAGLWRSGRYIPSVDHSVPPIVSYENYRYYIDSLRRACKV